MRKHLLFFLKWFHNNFMRVNSDKSHLLMSANKAIDNNRIKCEDIIEVFGITIDSKLTF